MTRVLLRMLWKVRLALRMRSMACSFVAAAVRCTKRLLYQHWTKTVILLYQWALLRPPLSPNTQEETQGQVE